MIIFFIVLAALIAFLGWAAHKQRRRGGSNRPEESGRDKGMTYLP